MTDTISNDPAGPVLGTMHVLRGTIEGYVDGASRTEIDSVPVDGMILHWAAQLDDGTITGTVWRDRALADHFLTKVLAETFTEMAAAPEQIVRPRPDYSYDMIPMIRFASGRDASMVVGRKLGEAAGTVLLRPIGDLAALDLSESVPEGLIAHIVMADGWIDLWLDRGAPEGHYATTELEIVPLHTLIVNPTELAHLPEYPPAA
jgi:hypothetical protein